MQNIGTLITAPIRVNDSLDLIASAFATEIKGGHHSYATLVERNSIILARREWGMTCEVYNDTINTGIYKLKYNKVDTNISNNANWEVVSNLGSINTTIKEFYITGNSTNISFIFTHSLNNRKVLINVSKDFGDYEQINPRIYTTSLNTVTIEFQVIPITGENYNVEVIGIDKNSSYVPPTGGSIGSGLLGTTFIVG